MTTYQTFPTLLISDEVLFDSATLGEIIWQQHDQVFFDMAEELGLLNRATMNDPEPQLLLDWRAEMEENLQRLNGSCLYHFDHRIDERLLTDMYLFLWERAEKDSETQAEWKDWQKRKEKLNKKHEAAYEKAQRTGGY
jgi:hypothetical protein